MGRGLASAASGYRTGALAAALALGFAAAAPDVRAAEGDWYVGAQVPVMFIDDSVSTTTGNQTVAGALPVPYRAEATSEYEAGFKAAGVLGYELGGGMRVEGELFFARAKVDKLTYGGVTAFGLPVPGTVDVPVGGSARQTGAMVNLWLDLPTGSDWVPYIGGGLGFIRVDQGGLRYDPDTLVRESLQRVFADPQSQATLVQQLPPALAAGFATDPQAAVGQLLASIDVPDISTTDTRFAYHLGLGVGYRLNDNTTLQMGYRLQAASDFEFDGRNAQGAIDVKTELRAHLFEIGFRTRF